MKHITRSDDVEGVAHLVSEEMQRVIEHDLSPVPALGSARRGRRPRAPRRERGGQGAKALPEKRRLGRSPVGEDAAAFPVRRFSPPLNVCSATINSLLVRASNGQGGGGGVDQDLVLPVMLMVAARLHLVH